MSQEDYSGYTVAYEREEIQFPVYVVLLVGVALIVAARSVDSVILLTLGLIALGFTYYNFPLLEIGRPRIGAGQYGVFLEGLGIIAWGAIEDISLTPVESRGVMQTEMHLALRQPLERALIADWRRRPYYRYLMRLPWSMRGRDIVRVPLEVLDQPPDEIHRAFTRMMAFYRR